MSTQRIQNEDIENQLALGGYPFADRNLGWLLEWCVPDPEACPEEFSRLGPEYEGLCCPDHPDAALFERATLHSAGSGPCAFGAGTCTVWAVDGAVVARHSYCYN